MAMSLTLEELGQALVALGCPEEKAPFMADQLDKRARQLAEAKGTTQDDALKHLLSLMKEGWAARERGL
jgi:hypothetical protein